MTTMKFTAMAPESGVLISASPAGVERNPDAPIEQIISSEAEWRWLHLDHNRPNAAEWLRLQEDLPEDVADAMLATQTRPRCVQWKGGLLFIGRGVNLNAESLPEDMVSIRAWLTPGRLVTVVRRRLRAAEDVAAAIEQPSPKVQVEAAGELLLMLIENLLERMAPTVNESGEQIDDYLEDVIDEETKVDRRDIARLRLRIITMRRYALPLREAVSELRLAPPDLMPPDLTPALVEVADRVTRIVDELDNQNIRAELARAEVAGLEDETLNRRLYALAVVTAIFLPLSFLTGLLGMNVAGIPFTQPEWSIWVWGTVFVLVLAGQLWLLRKLGWL